MKTYRALEILAKGKPVYNKKEIESTNNRGNVILNKLESDKLRWQRLLTHCVGRDRVAGREAEELYISQSGTIPTRSIFWLTIVMTTTNAAETTLATAPVLKPILAGVVLV